MNRKHARPTSEIRTALTNIYDGRSIGSAWIRDRFVEILDLLDELRCTEHDECRDDPEMGIKCATERIRRERAAGSPARAGDYPEQG